MHLRMCRPKPCHELANPARHRLGFGQVVQVVGVAVRLLGLQLMLEKHNRRPIDVNHLSIPFVILIFGRPLTSRSHSIVQAASASPTAIPLDLSSWCRLIGARTSAKLRICSGTNRRAHLSKRRIPEGCFRTGHNLTFPERGAPHRVSDRGRSGVRHRTRCGPTRLPDGVSRSSSSSNRLCFTI
jgi:hypothetical protein